MNHKLRFAFLIGFKGDKYSIKNETLVPMGFDFKNPAECVGKIVKPIQEYSDHVFQNCCLMVNEARGFAEFTSHGLHIMWHNEEEHFASLTIDERVDLYLSCERIFLGSFTNRFKETIIEVLNSQEEA